MNFSKIDKNLIFSKILQKSTKSRFFLKLANRLFQNLIKNWFPQNPALKLELINFLKIEKAGPDSKKQKKKKSEKNIHQKFQRFCKILQNFSNIWRILIKKIKKLICYLAETVFYLFKIVLRLSFFFPFFLEGGGLFKAEKINSIQMRASR